MIAAITLNVSIDRRYAVENDRHGAVNRVKECAYTAGGKGLNVARVLNKLGEPVIAGGIVGGDSGNYVLRRLDEERVAHRFGKAAGETRSCINVLDMSTGKQTEYLEPGMTVSAEEYAAFLDTFDKLASECKVITLSGSLPGGLKTETYAELIARGKAQGCAMLLDTSGNALKAGVNACPDYIKPNEDEIKALVGREISDENELAQAALELHKRGIARVVISMGSRGAMMACGGRVLRGMPPKIDAVNTVGCGDSMTAAFAAAALRGMDDENALRYAIAVSAASALSPETGGLEPSSMEAILPQVQVRCLVA